MRKYTFAPIKVLLCVQIYADIFVLYMQKYMQLHIKGFSFLFFFFFLLFFSIECGVRQLGAVVIGPYHQGAGRIK